MRWLLWQVLEIFARIASVSPASASRILNNDPTFHINDEARKRVIHVANKLHYSKGKKKRGPKQNDPQLSIALIMRHDHAREIDDPYFLNMHMGLICIWGLMMKLKNGI